MRTFYYRLLWSLVLLLSITQINFAQTSLVGKVTDGSSGEPILFGNVALYQKGILITGVETDFDGNYNIFNIDAGMYDIEATYVGLNPIRITDVIIHENKVNKLDIKFVKNTGISLNKVVISNCHGRLIEPDYVCNPKVIKTKKVKKAKKTSLSGQVIDSETGETIPFCNVALHQEELLINTIVTDFDGNYTFDDLKAGSYTVKSSFVGMKTTITNDVILFEGKITKLNIQMGTNSTSLDEIKTLEYRVPLFKESAISRVDKPSKPRSSKKKKKSKVISTTPTAATPIVYDVAVLSEETEVYSPAMSKEIRVTEDIAEEDFEKDAGQITAGEWKDLDNWTFWRDLQKDETYTKWQSHWHFYPTKRYSVAITGTQDQPVLDAEVLLLDKTDAIIWQGKTDNKGRSELWSSVYGAAKEVAKIKIRYQGYETTSRNIREYSESGINHFKIPVNCAASKDVDIFFAVDATGSMGDEIQFLKAELKDVIERAKEDNEKLNVRLGSVFYRDKGDAYVTQVSPFSENLSKTINFIRNQYAGGGGDYPEAVHSALEEALKQEWSATARSRMLFLLLDAPPHHNTAVQASLQKSIEKAAKMGVKVIPITASGIKKDTEFLMKYFSIITNSTYTFITDHSGIGNAHLTPTAEEYNVETLNELMLRLILENTEFDACDEEDSNNLIQKVYPVFPVQPNLDYIQNQNLLQDIHIFPNPAKGHFFLDLKTDFDKIYLLNQNGQLVKSFTDISIGKTERNINDIAAGMYILYFVKGKQMTSEKLVVIKD